MVDPSPLAAVGATIPTPPFIFGAKSQMRLKVAYDLIRYYDTTGRPLTATNIQWDPVMSRFKELWNALKIRRKADDPVTPKISKALPIIRWTEAFIDHLHRCIGVRLIPLAYVTRPDTAVPADVPTLATDQPFSTENGSLEAELISRESHRMTVRMSTTSSRKQLAGHPMRIPSSLSNVGKMDEVPFSRFNLSTRVLTNGKPR